MPNAPQPPSQQPMSSWGSRLRRSEAGPPRKFVYYSIGIHLGLVALLILSGVRLRAVPQFEQFRVTLISPPAQVQGTPEPVTTSAPVVAEKVPPKAEPKPEKQPARTQAAKPKTVEKKTETPARGPDPKPVPVGGENIQVVQDGKDFQYPEYLENIALQITRYFRWSGPADLEAEVIFYINTDGTIGGFRVTRRSGNRQFDMQTAEALEEIGRAKAFGPLPEGWQRDKLYISFTFQKPKQ